MENRIRLTESTKDIIEKKALELEPLLKLKNSREKIDYIVFDWVKKMREEHQKLLKGDKDSNLHNGDIVQVENLNPENLLKNNSILVDFFDFENKTREYYKAENPPKNIGELI
jgi:hypothetical protein